MIRIRFVTGNDLISNAIRAGERDGWCTHVEAIMPDGTLIGAHINGGVEARPTDYDKGTRTRELIVELRADNDQETAFARFLDHQLGKPYDTTAVIGLGLSAFVPFLGYVAATIASSIGLNQIAHKDRDWREPDSWFCSELIAAALEVCGYLPRLSAADNHISPRDLLLVLSGRATIDDAS
jgi:hypothetical protein